MSIIFTPERQKYLHKIFNKFQKGLLGISNKKQHHEDVEMKTYAVYILKHGTKEEKRELMSCFRSKIRITKGVVEIDK
jgi:hypothetical protein